MTSIINKGNYIYRIILKRFFDYYPALAGLGSLYGCPLFLCCDVKKVSYRSVIYIDGLNLYYGALKDTPWKWLDLERYFHLLRSNDSIQAIKYFTGKAIKSGDQETYLAALASTIVQIFLSPFKNKRITCRVRGCTFSGSRKFGYPEEKKTDVNLGVHLVNDAHKNRYDLAVMVSGDSDIIPALEMVKQEYPEKKLICYVPDSSGRRGIGNDLRATLSSRCRILPNNLLAKAQFQPRVSDGHGGWTVKPADW